MRGVLTVRARVALRAVLLAAVVVASGFLAWWSWRTSSALAALGERSIIESTVLLVREKIEDGSILIWREWEDGSGMPTQARWEAAKRMIMLDTCDDPSACFPRRSKFVVVDEGGRPALREEERQ